MIIVPVKPVDSTDPELLPIKMVVEGRLDVLALYLRLLRYLSSAGIFGEDLLWEDSDASPIYIAKTSDSATREINFAPAILLTISGYNTKELSFMHSMANATEEGVTRLTDMPLGVSFIVRGRNEMETYRIADLLSAYLDITRPSVLASALNLEYMSGVSVGPVREYRDASGNSYMWECSMSISVSVNRYYGTKHYSMPGSPDPEINKGVSLGQAARMYKQHSAVRPLFSYADFVLTAGGTPDYDYTVSTQLIFDGQSEELAKAKMQAGTVFTAEISNQGNFGTVPVNTESDPLELKIKLETSGTAVFNIILPEGVYIKDPFSPGGLSALISGVTLEKK